MHREGKVQQERSVPVKHDPAGRLRVVVSHHGSWPSHLESEWRALWRATQRNVFMSPAWVRSWMDSFAEYPMTVLEAREGDALRGLLPLTLQRRSIHRRIPVKLRFWGVAGAGIGAADHVTPLAVNQEVMDTLLRTALECTSDRPLLLEHLDGALAANCEALGLERLGSTPVPRLDLSEVDDAAGVWSSKLRKNLRRRRRMADEAEIRSRWLVEPEDVQLGLGVLHELHLARWRSKGQRGLLDDQRMSFLKALCAEPDMGARIHLLEGPQEPVGALLVFCTPSSMSSYKTGWNPAHADLGVGIRLHADAIESAIAEGLDLYDFLRGTGGHKYTLNAQDYADVTYGRFKGPGGRVLRYREQHSYAAATLPAEVPE